jgi:hypothetical protein
MTIPESVYESLTPMQRVAAAVAASAREDAAELGLLARTCRKRTFTITDPDYTDAMSRLTTLAMILELNLRALALDFYVSATGGCERRNGSDQRSTEEILAEADICENRLNEFASHLEAMSLFAESEGIDPADLQKFGMPHHPIVRALVTMAIGEPDPELVAAYVDQNRAFFRGQLA